MGSLCLVSSPLLDLKRALRSTCSPDTITTKADSLARIKRQIYGRRSVGVRYHKLCRLLKYSESSAALCRA
jgi:hypothetical protein